MKSLRVLWLSHLLPWPPKGGLTQRSYNLMREVSRHHDVEVVALHQRAHQPTEEKTRAALSAISEFARVAHYAPLPEDVFIGGQAGMAFRSLWPGPPYTVRWGLSDAYRKAVRQTVNTFRPDVVHFDTISLAPYISEVGDIPAVLNHHNIESAMLLRRAEQETNKAKKWYFRQEGRRLADYERKIAGRFKRHLVCAELDEQRLRETVGPVPTAVIPNGVDPAEFRPAPRDRVPDLDSLVFVGGLSWYPNASAIRFFLNEVWPELAARRPGVEFRLIGRHAPEDIHELSRRDPRIKVMGFVDEILPIVHKSMVYVCPIFDGGGTKLKMLDAMAMGKAIVAHPVACEGLRTTHGTHLLEAEDPDSFVSQILQIFDEPELRASLEQEARAHVTRLFSFRSIGEKLSRIYATVADEDNPSARDLPRE